MFYHLIFASMYLSGGGGKGRNFSFPLNCSKWGFYYKTIIVELEIIL